MTETEHPTPHPAWRKYRIWRAALWILFFTYLPAGVLTSLVARHFTSSERPGMFVAFAWMAVWSVCIFCVGWARCPRCQNHVHRRGLWSNPFSGRCLNCGLRIGGDPSRRPDLYDRW